MKNEGNKKNDLVLIINLFFCLCSCVTWLVGACYSCSYSPSSYIRKSIYIISYQLATLCINGPCLLLAQDSHQILGLYSHQALTLDFFGTILSGIICHEIYFINILCKFDGLQIFSPPPPFQLNMLLF